MLQIVLQENEKIVSSYDDFLFWVKEKPDRHREAAQEKMSVLKENLDGEDPLYHLHNLYYNERKSLSEILKSDKILNIQFFPKATLHRLLFERFWWIPRENTERTPVHEKQLSKKVAWEILEFESKVADLVGWRRILRVFRMDEFTKKTYKIWKALYILKTLWGIDKNMLYKLSVDWGLSHAVLAKSLNKELKKILIKNPELGIDFCDIELYPQSINRWFQYNSDKL